MDKPSYCEICATASIPADEYGLIHKAGSHITGVCNNCIQKSKPYIALESYINRLKDLVRYMRSELHDEGLLTDEEYAVLAADNQSVARLESYDEIRARLRKEYKSQQDSRSKEKAEEEE